MRYVRFLDDQNHVQFGCGYDGQTADRMTGPPLAPASGEPPGEPTGERIAVRRLLCPIQPTAILCIGLNYRQHAAETGAELPDHPVLFMKNPAAAHHPDMPIVLPEGLADAPETDYECELALVIGQAAKNISADEAPDHVLGYTVANDVSARRWQKRGGGGQWVRGKSFDTFCPFGPELVTADELEAHGGVQGLDLSTTLNGKTMQRSNTSDMIFSVAEIVSFLSRDTTLLPGTLILTGTPEGVGVARDPRVFLEAGDTVTCAIAGIGELTNSVVDR